MSDVGLTGGRGVVLSFKQTIIITVNLYPIEDENVAEN